MYVMGYKYWLKTKKNLRNKYRMKTYRIKVNNWIHSCKLLESKEVKREWNSETEWISHFMVSRCLIFWNTAPGSDSRGRYCSRTSQCGHENALSNHIICSNGAFHCITSRYSLTAPANWLSLNRKYNVVA